ncbi:MAG: hypothetical protein CFK52_02560 [Chloracidobacterium sp. CP2_5A]|nr:MAG: hypothetical protein CFK52_02560 [Chloracidobacterium sp. CP2_5A]
MQPIAQPLRAAMGRRLTQVAFATAFQLSLSATLLAIESPLAALDEAPQAPSSPPIEIESALRQPSVYLGVFPQTLSEQKATELGVSPPQGVYLIKVIEGSPADKAGLKQGDAIVSINGQAIINGEHFRDLLRKQTPGQAMTLGVVRDKQLISVSVVPEKPRVSRLALPDGQFGIAIDPEASRKSAERMREMAEQMRRLGEQRRFELKGNGMTMAYSDRGRLGVRTQTLSEQLASYFGVTEGVLVTEVLPGSAAEKAGIRAGDCLVKVGDRPIRDGRDLTQEIRRVEAGEIKVTLVRNKQSLVVTATLDPAKPQGALQFGPLDLYFEARPPRIEFFYGPM